MHDCIIYPFFYIISVFQVDPDPEILARTLYEVKIRNNVTIDCPYGPGALPQFYAIDWTQIFENGVFTPMTPTFQQDGYEILSNFSLRINASEVVFPRTRDRFRCSVRIEMPTRTRSIGSSNLIQVKTFSKCFCYFAGVLVITTFISQPIANYIDCQLSLHVLGNECSILKLSVGDEMGMP